MSKRLDLANHRFEHLVALKYVGHSQWLCRCDCGTELTTATNNLMAGKSKSCGHCQYSQKGHGRGEAWLGVHIQDAAWKQYMRVTRDSARYKNLPFELTLEQIKDLCTQPCEYCGVLPTRIITTLNGFDPTSMNGIDRVDSAKGYTIDNCVSCCSNCNYMKRNLTVEEFLEHVLAIARQIPQKVC